MRGLRIWVGRILLLLAGLREAAASLQSFDEPFVRQWLNKSASLDLSARCTESLARVWPYLNMHDTFELQRNYYHQSFGAGPAWLFLSRDQDRWVYRGYECLLAAGETVYSRSEHPMHFCYGINENEEPGTEAYSICIPSPCEKEHKQLLGLWQEVVDEEQADASKMDFTSCIASRHEKQWFELPIPVADFIFNAMLSLFVCLATVFHMHRGDDVKTMSQKMLLCFSLKKNLKKATCYPKDPQSTITCMFGLRFLTMAWTLIGHSFIFIQAYLGNVDEFKDEMVNSFWRQWITNFTLSVDVFLTLGGTVLSYSWFRKWLKNTTEPEPSWNSWGYWFRFYQHRIIRLWPAYLYTLMAVTLRLSVTHWHPMWPPTDPAIQCPKYWWQNALFINSLTQNRCMPWTWYIGTEFIFYVVSPIFLLSLRKSPKFGLLVCIITILASGILNVVTILQENFPPTQFLWKQPEIFNPNFIQHHVQLYIKPQYRIAPYVIGILLGYYLANYQKGASKQPRSRSFVLGGWAMALLAMFLSMYGLYPSLQGWDWGVYHTLYGATHRVIFSLGLAWVLYACHTGIGGPVNALLSWYPMVPLANLSYSAYLFHMIPVVLTYLLVPFPIMNNSMWYIFAHCAVQLVISYVFAFICSTSVEYPAQNMERLLLYNTPKKSHLKPVQTAESELQLKD
ncbi:unnamed protein product, partial [Mesorhabditis spiculigera]